VDKFWDIYRLIKKREIIKKHVFAKVKKESFSE